jgi:hypothetical protein
MDRIQPIGSPEHDVPRVDPVRPRQVSREEREQRRREQERRERERRAAEADLLAPEEGDEEGNEGGPHIDVRA